MVYPYIPWFELNKLRSNDANNEDAPCLDDDGILNFLNRQDVIIALHVNVGAKWDV